MEMVAAVEKIERGIRVRLLVNKMAEAVVEMK